MADGTIQTAGDKISTDELVTLNGAAVPAGGEKVQRFKVGFGSDSVLRDVDAANPLPVSNPTALPLPTGAATDGTDGTTPPAVLGGGTGIRGWLRSIYEKLTGSIAVTGTFWQTTQPVSGPLTAAQTLTAVTTVTNLVQQGGVAISLNTGVRDTGTQRVTIATNDLVPVSGPLTDAQLRASAVPVTSATPPTTYGASITGLALALLATDVFVISGSATKTVRITKISFDAIQTTAGQAIIILARRSTADTLGTSTAPVAVTFDTTNAAATAVVLAYTANPTLGTLVGNVFSGRVFVPGAAPFRAGSKTADQHHRPLEIVPAHP